MVSATTADSLRTLHDYSDASKRLYFSRLKVVDGRRPGRPCEGSFCVAKRAIEPITRSTLSSTVTERLRELIVQGTYAPGTQLSEVELADRFGVSRGPIREALQRLTQEGLLRSEAHRGTFVPVFSDADVADVYLARDAIEHAALQVIAKRPDRKDIAARLTRLVRDMRRAAAAQRWSTVADLDLNFHLAVVRSAGSPRLSRMYATLIDETRVLIHVIAISGREDLVDEHADLARLLEAGDIDGALAALEEHFRVTRSLFQPGSMDGPHHPA